MFSRIRIHLARALLPLGICALASACQVEAASNSPSREDCERLRAHVAAVQVAKVPTADGSAAAVKAELRKHERNVERALGEAFVKECQSARTRAYVGCALEANNAETMTACDG